MMQGVPWTRLRVAVVVASRGRPGDLALLLDHLGRQTVAPCSIVLSVNAPSDLPPDSASRARVVVGGDGLTAQRNLGMAQVMGDCDVIAFLDDDYLPVPTAIEGMARLFADHPDVIGANGVLLADGAVTGTVSLEDVETLFARHAASQGEAWVRPHSVNRGFYGCNMAFRAAAIAGLSFDEKLPLYGWQEDFDFAGQVARRKGRLVHTSHFVGVHRGVRGGRVSGVRLGYSQIANPIHLMRKGTMSPRRAIPLMLKNILSNHARALKGETDVDRAGRARGNRWALNHILHRELDTLFVVRIGTCRAVDGLDKPETKTSMASAFDAAMEWMARRA